LTNGQRKLDRGQHSYPKKKNGKDVTVNPKKIKHSWCDVDLVDRTGVAGEEYIANAGLVDAVSVTRARQRI
jgi:hypothetical protein